MSARPTRPDGADQLGERIAGLQGILGCIVSTLLTLIVTGAWLWINANLPAANPLAPAPPPPTAANAPISQMTPTPTPIVR